MQFKHVVCMQCFDNNQKHASDSYYDDLHHPTKTLYAIYIMRERTDIARSGITVTIILAVDGLFIL